MIGSRAVSTMFDGIGQLLNRTRIVPQIRIAGANHFVQWTFKVLIFHRYFLPDKILNILD
jgi:hypothetical protein